MSSRTRRLAGLLGAGGAVLLLALADARAQPRGVPTPAPPPGGAALPAKTADEKTPFSDAVTLPTHRESKRLIQAAQDYIKKQEWGTAAECLQQLLEDKQDSFIEID